MAARYKLVGNPPLPVGQRPKCRWCGKELRPNFRTVDYSEKPWKKEFDGTYGCSRESMFCQARHGQWWAELTIKQTLNGELKVTRVKPKREGS